ncbi:MAG: ATP-binding cassette domain-containing protein, partial [Candidatus Hodarchaeales archaeon]
MAKIIFKDLNKTFGEGPPAVDDINLEIHDKEFMVLVGPSGCGKTTTLRMLAGLETPTSGSIFIGEKEVTHVVPKDRDIAMVFQSYALYPHMSVRENMSFGLKNRELSSGEKVTSTIIKTAVYTLILISLVIVSTILDVIFFPGSGSVFALSSILAFLIGLLLYPELKKSISDFSLNRTANFIPSIKDYLAKNKEIDERV